LSPPKKIPSNLKKNIAIIPASKNIFIFFRIKKIILFSKIYILDFSGLINYPAIKRAKPILVADKFENCDFLKKK